MKRLKLDQLTVKSFITHRQQNELEGGGPPTATWMRTCTDPPNCQASDQCSIIECPI